MVRLIKNNRPRPSNWQIGCFHECVAYAVRLQSVYFTESCVIKWTAGGTDTQRMNGNTLKKNSDAFDAQQTCSDLTETLIQNKIICSLIKSFIWRNEWHEFSTLPAFPSQCSKHRTRCGFTSGFLHPSHHHAHVPARKCSINGQCNGFKLPSNYYLPGNLKPVSSYLPVIWYRFQTTSVVLRGVSPKQSLSDAWALVYFFFPYTDILQMIIIKTLNNTYVH